MHIILEKYFELFWKILKLISTIIGVEATIKCSSLLGTFSSYLFKRERQIALAQLGIPKVKSFLIEPPELIIKNSFSHVGESIGEVLCIDKIFDQVGTGKVKDNVPGITYSNFNEISNLIKNGGMALSGHIGSIELLAAYHIQRGIPLNVIARSPNYKSAAVTLEKLRKKYGVVVAWRENSDSLRILSKAIKSGALVAALIDQDTPLDSIYGNFFGLDSASPIAPIKLALKYELPIVTSFIYRVRKLKHHIATEQIIYNPKDKNVEQMIIDTYNSRLEKVIKAYPEQWLWWHRRWRRQQNMVHPPSTKEYIKWLKQA